MSGLDERWLKAHIETNLFEIAGGQAALSKAALPTGTLGHLTQRVDSQA